MIYNNYKILEIKGVNHSKYGNCLMAYANPVTRKEQTYEFNPTIDKRSFEFLLSSRFLDELQTIANTLDFWTPDENMSILSYIHSHGP